MKFIRKRHHIIQKELGQEAGLSKQNTGIRVTQYERGKRQPKEEALSKIVDILEILVVF
ncbi:helix-turn-helix domain-containing protein [Longibaculum muris]|uniref:helix-turn-helix domain-containing protein n=1 Tax=Longibaculum muris TaxID=1796628 RepID=UPI0037CA842E